MCFGRINDARVQLNEESIWAGPPVPEPTKAFRKAMQQARKEWLSSDYETASERLQAALSPSLKWGHFVKTHFSTETA